MLTDGDRTQLAPYLTDIHTTRAALARAERTSAEADRYLAEFKRDTTLWDRWLNRDGPTGLAYRSARKVRDDTAAAVATTRERLDLAYGRLDRLITPLMSRLDPRYDARALVVDSCAHALRQCRATRAPLETFLATVRDATRHGRDEKARKDAVSARLRYPGHLAEARTATAAVKRAVDAVRETVSVDRAARLVWNDGALGRLPRTADGIHVLQILVREEPEMRQILSRHDLLRAELTRLRSETTAAQRTARSSARDRLIRESAPVAG